MTAPVPAEVHVERVGAVAILTVDRPRQRNALARHTMDALETAVSALVGDGALRAVVLAGGGDTFISGGDLRDLHTLTTAEAGATMSRRMQHVLDMLEALPVPVIAAIEGCALGGGVEVALAADLRVMAADAWLAFRQIDLAVTTGWGGTWRLTRLVGRARALRLVWTGETVTSAEAHRLGLADRVAAPGQPALDAALVLAQQLAAQPTHAVAAYKTLVARADLPLAEHHTLEADLFGDIWAHPAHGEAVARFMNRPRRAAAEPPRQDGFLIVFEGIDGAGTTTQARLLARWLTRAGRTVHSTAQPSTGPLGRLLRQALSCTIVGREGQRLCPESIALLFAADRFDHLRTEIEPRLSAGTDVICDRYDHSSLAYQGTENDPRWVSELNAAARRPDLILFLDVDAAVASARRARRAQAADLYEVDELQARIAQAYRGMERWRPADPVVRVDGHQSVRAVQKACRQAVLSLLQRRRAAPTGEGQRD